LREGYGWRQIAMANPKPGMGPIEYASKILNSSVGLRPPAAIADDRVTFGPIASQEAQRLAELVARRRQIVEMIVKLIWSA
jgi:hypothetical protein